MPARDRATPTGPFGLIAPQGLIPCFGDPIRMRLYRPRMTIIPEGEYTQVLYRLTDHWIHPKSIPLWGVLLRLPQSNCSDIRDLAAFFSAWWVSMTFVTHSPWHESESYPL